MLIKLIQKIEKISTLKLKLIIVFLGIVIAAQIQYIQHGWINPDSTIYFESARLFSLGEWKAAYEVFQWPFYAMCIAAVHHLTHLGIQVSAQLLNIIFFGMATFSFIKLLQLANGKNLTIVIGALVFFSAQYTVGDVLEMLLRDQGFWAFFLASLVYLIRFRQKQAISDALAWQICAILATLFRIEAITYLLLLPFTLFFDHKNNLRSRFFNFLIANSLSVLCLLSIFVAIANSPKLSIESFGRLREVFTLDIYRELTGQLVEKAEIMSNQVLGHYLSEYAVATLVITFIYIILVKVIAATGLLNSAFAYLELKNNQNAIPKDTLHVLLTTALLSVINMALIITKVFVLSGRYVVALAFILMLFSSLYLGRLVEHLANQHQKADKKLTLKHWLIYAVLLVMVLGTIKNILPKNSSYNFRQDAVAWLKTHNTDNKPVFYDEPRLRYYADEPYIGSWGDTWQQAFKVINNKSIYQYDFLVIDSSSNSLSKEKRLKTLLPDYVEIKRFNNHNADKYIIIYQKAVSNTPND